MMIGVATWRAIGGTTTAFALAQAFATMGERPWLIEADPSGSVLGARVDGLAAHVGGLERIAFTSPGGGQSPGERFADEACAVAGVRVVAGAGDPFRAWACHQPRHDWVGDLAHLSGPTVVDLGTFRRGAPMGPLLRQLDLILVVANPDTVSLAGALDWLETGGRVAPDSPELGPELMRSSRLVVVDTPVVVERMRRLDLEAEMGERVMGWIGWSPLAVDHLHRGGAFTDRRVQRDPFVAEVLTLANRSRDTARAA